MNAGIHADVVAFPYLEISIRQPCLNFAVSSSYMLPRRLRRLDVLLNTAMTSKEQNNEFAGNSA